MNDSIENLVIYFYYWELSLSLSFYLQITNKNWITAWKVQSLISIVEILSLSFLHICLSQITNECLFKKVHQLFLSSIFYFFLFTHLSVMSNKWIVVFKVHSFVFITKVLSLALSHICLSQVINEWLLLNFSHLFL